MFKIITCILALTGCILVTGIIRSGEKLPAAAIIAGLISAFGYALYSIFGRFAIDYGYHSLTVSVYTFIISGIGAAMRSSRPCYENGFE